MHPQDNLYVSCPTQSKNPWQTVADRVPTGCRPLRVFGLAVVSHPLDLIANHLRHLCLSHCEPLAR
jgi:hypothetical protein